MTRRKTEVDISGFGAVLKALQKLSGKTHEQVLKAEAGMILKSTIQKIKIAEVNGRMLRGKRRGGIVDQNIPDGMAFAGGQGRKLITKENGRTYHIGKPVVAGRKPSRTIGKGKNKSLKVGAKIYSRPYPNQAWMKEKYFGRYVPKQKKTTERKIKHRGLTASQFYWMATKLGILLPKVKNIRVLQSPANAKIVKPRVQAIKKLGKNDCSITFGSKGIRMSGKRGVQQKLLLSTKARINLMRRAVKNNWISDMKKFMPSRYPLLFSK